MNIAKVQLVRKLVLAVAVLISVALFAVSNSTHPSGQSIHEMIEWVGVVLIVICILGRTWCTLYIGGRKISHFVTAGPYSVMRNPLYFFSTLGAAGCGLQLGSVVVGIMLAALAWLVFRIVVVQEERLLQARYGEAFAAYLATVPRFMPNPALWRDAATVTVAPPQLFRTFADAMLFLLSVPVAEGFEKLQHIGALPVLFLVP